MIQNEEAHIEKAIQSVHIPGEEMQPEVIVVDAGSNDQTCVLASRQPGVKVLQVPGGRGAQLNVGVTTFLHEPGRN
jgi:glycosyltransferase involved in cell wall biosynthesis